MRIRTLVLWLVSLGVLAWGGVTIVAAGSSYLEASGIIDQGVADAMARRKTQIGSGMTVEANRDFMANVRTAILSATRARNFPLEADELILSATQEGVRVTAKWSFPVTVYQDWTLFLVPMSVTRTYGS